MLRMWCGNVAKVCIQWGQMTPRDDKEAGEREDWIGELTGPAEPHPYWQDADAQEEMAVSWVTFTRP